MPFDSGVLQPSIGLGLLKAGLTPLNISTRILYFSLRFAELIGTSLYDRIAAGCSLVGEWLFAGALFDFASLGAEGYIEDVLRERSPAQKRLGIRIRVYSLPEAGPREAFIQDVLAARGKVEGFLDECLWKVASYHPTIVGFTSTFQQQVASLSLAKRIKAQSPETFIVFGGANCEGIMGAKVVRQFPFVDAVVSGEGDIVFPELVRRVLERRSFSDLQGVYTRDNVGLNINGQYPNAPSVRDMDVLPFPDYDDFFEQLETSCLEKYHPPRIQFETSRGCWWGEKSHCTFCGLNGASMDYRSKSSERALNELIYLTNRYPGRPVSVVDNILDMKYFKDFIPELAARQLDVELFYEVKANLKKEQVRLLRDAGIMMIQPGIESLSSHVLKLMRKGVTGLQNIQLLKWCKELGITPFWNMLCGFPGESPEEYARMADLIPYLTHLRPPASVGTIRLDRFSPNFDHAEQFGFVDVAPYPAYHYIYPLAPEVVADLAYYFTFRYREPQDVESYTKPLVEQLIAWAKAYEQSDLFSVDKATHLLIWDLRPVAHEPLTVLTGLQRVLYSACDRAHTVSQLQQLVEQHSGEAISVQELEELLGPLMERGLMLRESNTYLGLAIPLGEYSPGRPILERFREVARTLGKASEDKIVIPLADDARRR